MKESGLAYVSENDSITTKSKGRKIETITNMSIRLHNALMNSQEQQICIQVYYNYVLVTVVKRRHRSP